MTNSAMTDSDHPWEPPLAGTESEHLLGALGRMRTTFRWKADDLDAGGLQTRVGASSLTLGGLYYFTTKLSGQRCWTLADSTSSSTSPSPTVAMPACAGSSVT